MRIAICDDERYMLEIIEKKLYEYSEKHNWDSAVYTFDNGNELVKSNTNFDIVVLDYQMDAIDGLETARLLRKGKNQNTCIIFLTSYPEIAIPAYDVDTYRFVLKNNIDNGLTKALDDFRNIKSFDIDLLVRVDREDMSINTSHIAFIEVIDKKSYIHMGDGNVLITSTSLSSLYGKLPKTHFYRVHKAYVVNFSFILRRKDNNLYIKESNQIIPISRNYLSSYKTKYYNYLNDSN